jgi:uncharacterized membrane protein YhaH (DUF805 family)
MEWYLEVLKKYAVFAGRARRKEYWFYTLFSVIISLFLTLVDKTLVSPNSEFGAGLLSIVYALGTLIPSLAVAVRRLHDTDHSAWWLLIVLVPIIGPLVLLYFFVQEGNPSQNEYGSNPKLLV